MHFGWTKQDEAFRARVRSFLKRELPDNWADISRHGPGSPEQTEFSLEFCPRLAAEGLLVPHWPKEWGGSERPVWEHFILGEEMWAAGEPRGGQYMNVNWIGPTLMQFGTEAQKQRYIPEMAAGKAVWCQGFSEPNAGSDLASLQTRAEDKGDHFLVNGQKIWTSYADKADWIFCLVRTDPSATKHNGISFALFDMNTPGVTTRPIELISGESPFCETFFDDVKVAKGNVVGELNRGWDVAKYLLTHERNNIGGEPPGYLRGKALGPLAAEHVGREHGKLADTALRADIANLEIDNLAFRALLEKIRAEAEAGQGVGAQSAVLKYYGTELNKRRYELMMDAMGAEGLEWESERTQGGMFAREWLRSKGNSIEGGTSEVMLSIVSKRLLGLPDA